MRDNISSPDNMISVGFIYEEKILKTIISQKKKFTGFHESKNIAKKKKKSPEK